MSSPNIARIVGGNSEYGRVKSDYYPTPPEVTEALMQFLDLPAGTAIWECAAGKNHMVNVMRDHGYRVIASDIETGYDFMETPLVDCDWIITNPPFSLSEQFISKCIEHRKPFALLLKSHYWHARRRLNLFMDHPPAYILPLTWRPDFFFKARGGGSPMLDVMWCVWNTEKAESTKYIPLKKPEEVKKS